MAQNDQQIAPTRGEKHDVLSVFLGRWRAEGMSYGSPNQPKDNPKSAAEKWTSTHTATWHTGQFFLLQDERAMIGGKPFDTLSVLGVDAGTGRHVARTFDNHGFYRHYDLAVDGRVWTVTGATATARADLLHRRTAEPAACTLESVRMRSGFFRCSFTELRFHAVHNGPEFAERCLTTAPRPTSATCACTARHHVVD
jgi:Protein of unknown function (DUF1579)